MDDFPQLHLHIGAHKTATTHLQKTFYRNDAVIAAAGVRFLGPKQLRDVKNGVDGSFSLGSDLSGLRARLIGLAAGADQLVLSDENYAGQLAKAGRFAGQRFYENADRRLAHFMAALEGISVQVFLSVRDPADFLVSAYIQTLRGGSALPFTDFAGGVDPAALRWSELVRRIKSVPGVAGVTLWRQEDYPAVLSDITAALLHPALAGKLRPIEGRVHEALTAEAVAFLLDHAGTAPRRALVQTARESFPQGDATTSRFQPWGDALRAASCAEYDADLAAPMNRAGITLLRPARQ